MGKRAARWAAPSLWVSCLLLCALGLFFAYRSGFDTDFSQYLPNLILGGLGFSTVGALVAYNRPGNAIGWLLCATGLLQAVTAFGGEYGTYALAAGPLPGRVLALWFSSWTWLAVGSVVLFAFMLFPDGCLPSPRWRPAAWVYVLVSLWGVAPLALAPGPIVGTGTQGLPPVMNPFGVEALGGMVEPAVGLSFPLAVFTGLMPFVALFVRYRRAEGEEGRQQIKWVAYAVVLLTGAMTVVSVWPPLEGSLPGLLLFMVGFLSIPSAIGIAILRYRLFDIDLVINRTLVYAVLTTALVLVYVASVAGLQRLFSPVVGEGNQLAVVASTLLVAALFNPLRRRVQGFIDRRFYRRKYDATKTLESFGLRLREETHLGSLGEDLVGVVRETLQPEHASLWLRPANGPRDASGEVRR